jgi:hypothetical protein
MVHVTAKLKLRSCFETKSSKNCLLDRLTLHILIFFVITRCYVKILGSSWNEMNHFAVQVATCSVRYVRCKRNIVIIRKHFMLIILSRTNNIILVKDRRGSLTIEFVLNGAWSFLMP